MPDPEPTLEELCQQSPRLLGAEIAPLRGHLQGERYLEVCLRFDVTRLQIRAPEDRDGLACSFSDATGAAASLEDARESEPWWRVLGNPLVRAWAIRDPEGASAELALQFRLDDANPRIISLRRTRQGLQARCEPKEQWQRRVGSGTA